MEQKRLTKSLNNKVFSGVAGGIAEYFDVDPVLVRIAFVVALFINGIGLLAYIIGMIAMPKPDYRTYFSGNTQTPEGNEATLNAGEVRVQKKEKGSTFGFVLITLGILLLLHNLVSFVTFKTIFPVFLILIGGYILFRSLQNRSVQQ